MKTIAIFAAAALGLFAATSGQANAHGPSGIYTGTLSGFGHGGGYKNYSNFYRPNRGHVHYHNTGHYDYVPGGFVPHYNHVHYVPGSYQWHNTGHFDYHRGNHGHHHHH